MVHEGAVGAVGVAGVLRPFSAWSASRRTMVSTSAKFLLNASVKRRRKRRLMPARPSVRRARKARMRTMRGKPAVKAELTGYKA